MSRFKHECPEWDYMEIDETCPEFSCCYCEWGNPQIQELKKKYQELLALEHFLILEKVIK